MPSQHLRLCGHARVLVVIDTPALAETVQRAVRHGHHITSVVATHEECAEALATWKPHLVVIDMDRAASCILERYVAPVPHRGRIPVIALTRRSDLDAKLSAFDRGADDILTVPFRQEEFVARMAALLRRTYRDTLAFTPPLRLGDLKIDITNRRVRAGRTELHLTALEQSLLYLLAANAGRLLTRDEILDHLWGADYVAESNVVDRHIHNLRVKLQHDAHRARYIATVPGRGYRFVPTAADAAPLRSLR